MVNLKNGGLSMEKQLKLSSVSQTLFIPLYCRAMETLSNNPIIHDEKAVEIVRRLDIELASSSNKLISALIKRKFPKKLPVTMALRTRRFDQYVQDFIKNNDMPIIVNLGCGLDTRFERIDNGKIEWFDLDFPEVIDLRKQFFVESGRYHLIASSVLNFDWINVVLSNAKGRTLLFLAEGLLMYLEEQNVRELLLKLQSNFHGCELVCEVFNKHWIKKMQRGYYKWKFQKQLHLDKETVFTFGIGNSREFEEWNKGIEFIDEWTYFDDKEPKLGWFNLFKDFESLRKVQWTVHYRLN
jgi:methyltransferase (TIGR00027 family)